MYTTIFGHHCVGCSLGDQLDSAASGGKARQKRSKAARAEFRKSVRVLDELAETLTSAELVVHLKERGYRAEEDPRVSY